MILKHSSNATHLHCHEQHVTSSISSPRSPSHYSARAIHATQYELLTGSKVRSVWPIRKSSPGFLTRPPLIALQAPRPTNRKRTRLFATPHNEPAVTLIIQEPPVTETEVHAPPRLILTTQTPVLRPSTNARPRPAKTSPMLPKASRAAIEDRNGDVACGRERVREQNNQKE